MAAFFSYLGSNGHTEDQLTEHSCCPVLEGNKKMHGLNLLSYRLVVSRAFAREGEDVVVACSREEKVVLVACLFWQILPR